jgi:hypothetical protein
MPLALRYGKIAHVAESAPDPKASAPDPKASAPDPKALLREDLSKEYYAVLNVVFNFHGRLLTIKGWSVTLSLAALGLGFQQRHYALFFLAAASGAVFWILDAFMAGFQYRYFTRMREIEYTAYLINPVHVGGKYGRKRISAPRISMTWWFAAHPVGRDWRADIPPRQNVQETYKDYRRRFWWPSVMLPHVLAVVAGLLLGFAAAFNALGPEQLRL